MAQPVMTDSAGYSPGYSMQTHTHGYPPQMQRQSPTAFRRNLKKIDDGLGSKDVKELCFLCRDFGDLPWKELQDFTRGLQLFTALEKVDLLSQDDVSLLFELLETIKRRDLLRTARGIWPTQTSANQILRLSPYRKLLFDIANNTTTAELEDMKALACLPCATEDIKNPIQFMLAMEKTGMLASDNMNDLIEVMSNKMNTKKIEKYIASACTSQQPATIPYDYNDAPGSDVKLLPPQYFSLIPPGVTSSGHGASPLPVSSSDDVAGIEKTIKEMDLNDEQNETKGPDEHQNHENLAVESEKTLHSELLDVGSKKFDGVNRQASTLDSSNSIVSMQVTQDEHSQLITTGGENLPVRPHGSSRPDGNIPGTAQVIAEHPLMQRSVERCYRMAAKPLGICVIINNDKFYVQDEKTKKLKDRVGSEKDVEKLLNCFTKFNFEIIKKDNMPSHEMYRLFNDIVANPELKKHDAFVCCILTHGKMGQLAGSNSKYLKIQEIISVFTSEKCPNLAGKPKMFFLQACQGRDEQGLQEIEKDCPKPTKNEHGIGFGLKETIPNESDFLLGFATVPGYVSYRSKTTGSWYIPELVDALNDNYQEEDVMSILTIVNNNLSKGKAKREHGNMGQVPAPVMSLRKKVYFHRDENVEYVKC